MIKHCALKLWSLCQWVNYYSVLVQLNIAFYLLDTRFPEFPSVFNTSRHQWSHMCEIEKIAKLFKPCSLLSFLFSLLLFLCFLIIFFGNCNAYPLGFFRHQTSCYYSTQYQEMLNAKHNSHNIPEKWKQIEISKCKWIILIQKTMGNEMFFLWSHSSYLPSISRNNELIIVNGLIHPGTPNSKLFRRKSNN